jgi:hypothetical protein
VNHKLNLKKNSLEGIDNQVESAKNTVLANATHSGTTEQIGKVSR